jgi:LuxR family maltose regulon positive regulatory protein
MKDLGVKLSARERAIVRMMGHGLSNKGIARQLSIAPETVKSHAKSIFWKLTVRSRAEAVYRAAALGLI